MDTKGPEAEYLRDRIQACGHEALLLDVSTLGEPGGTPDIASETILSNAGYSREQLARTGVRGDIVAAMSKGAVRTVLQLYQERTIGGVIGIGGNQGSAIAATAMRALPIGFPKFLLSTVASGNIRPFVGHKDIAVMFSVSDFVGGLNVVSRSILANSAAAMCGMVDAGAAVYPDPDKTTVAVTALGNTEQAAHNAIELLRTRGYQVVAFHASGAGGSAMEELISADMIDAVLDLTLHELTEEVMNVGAYVPVTPGRLSVALEKGVPVVAATGGMEYLCFGPRSSIPEQMQDHVIYMHNPYNANVKIDEDELERVAAELARRFNKGAARAALFLPRKAWSVYGAEGGPFHDPEGIQRFAARLEETLDPGVEYRSFELEINDTEFAAACVDRLCELIEHHSHASVDNGAT